MTFLFAADNEGDGSIMRQDKHSPPSLNTGQTDDTFHTFWKCFSVRLSYFIMIGDNFGLRFLRTTRQILSRPVDFRVKIFDEFGNFLSCERNNNVFDP